ncbi:tripartite tricarboxylate transporter substrate binding protein [Roseomonas terrae]|uniref:Tripartite tricarboxylate transporter substrate binding protein n=2 Tax=Neoroseomonas terrae TaxID=424799 RepID=A0ABS5EQ96_9PROT|nr:tripartite tricarboxylate transporter substrate binding protein [Neoroseomonas terrae]
MLFTSMFGLAASGAAAQGAFPTRPIRITVPFAAGSATDIMMRHLSQHMQEALGQAIVIENRAGGAGVTGSEPVVRAPPDGYALLMAAVSSHAIAPALRANMPYDVLRDFTPIGLACTSTNFIVVHPSVPVHSLQELVAYSKELPGGMSYGSGGVGGSNHLAGELLRLRTGANLVHVPYGNQAQAVNDVLAGHVPMLIYTVAVLPHVQAGRMRALAVTSERRQLQAPDVPTAIEQGAAGVVANSWFAFFGPAHLPDVVRDKLYGAMRDALNDPGVAQKLVDTGLTPAPMGPEEFSVFLQAELAKWTDVGRAANVRL